MRPDVGLLQALRAPLALNLKALRACLAAESAKTGRHGRHRGTPRRGAGCSLARWRGHGLGSMVLLLGLAAAGGLAAALLASGAGEIAMLGLLALLAVAGVFLIFGLLSGFLRLGERVAEAEIVKTVADGLETASRSSTPQGTVLYRNRALQRLTGRRAGRHATLEELFAGEPDSAQAFFRLNRAAERGEAARGGVPRALAHRRWPRRAAGCAWRCGPFRARDRADGAA